VTAAKDISGSLPITGNLDTALDTKLVAACCKKKGTLYSKQIFEL
jgi:hypothetical protein